MVKLGCKNAKLFFTEPYVRLLPKSFQLDNLENSILNELSGFIARGKKEGFVETKKECKEILASLQFIRQKSQSQLEILINKITEDGFVRYEQGAGSKESRVQGAGSRVQGARRAGCRVVRVYWEVLMYDTGCGGIRYWQ